jgi:hypothetical protein
VLVEKEGNKQVIHGHSNKGRIYEIKKRRERLYKMSATMPPLSLSIP